MTRTTMTIAWALASLIVAIGMFGSLANDLNAAEPERDEREQQFTEVVRPFLQAYCYACHSAEKQEAELDLSADRTVADAARRHATWEAVLERLEAQDMPPEKALQQPTAEQRRKLVNWIRAFRQDEARRHAGDPGPVVASRLSNAEYNNTIRDLTGVDIRPAQEFPIDPANSAGFDNSGESLTMSPALLQKHLEAARRVSEHLVLTPDGIAFAPHPVQTDTDRDKYCVKRIITFYQRQPIDYADYFRAAWRYRHREALGQPTATLADIAQAEHVSPRYLQRIWSALTDENEDVGPMATLQNGWRELPQPNGPKSDGVRGRCEALRGFVIRLRKKLEFQFPDLQAASIHKGSQTFVLWKNRQYASHRRRLNVQALKVERADAVDEKDRDVDLLVPSSPTERARYEAAFARFCDLFPDAFFIAERGRDYLGKSKDEQEKGRLLSAGFHSMMGYFRDDGPLYDLILDAPQQAELDALWRELDFITAAPLRQYSGFLWFERTDSRYLRDAEFDFARAEDKHAASEELIDRLGKQYLQRAVEGGAKGAAVEAIEEYFRNINAQIRWVEQARLAAEPHHLRALTQVAERAYRRPLTDDERDDLLAFYRSLRLEQSLTHEEAVQDAFVSVLMSPHFCYRMDLAAAEGRPRPLTDYELAIRLSYFLWSSQPDRELLNRAAAGDLHRPEVIKAEARRLLQDDRVRGLALEFAGNWLDFRRFESHNSVDRDRFPSFTHELRQAMFEEPIRFFVDVVQRDRSALDFLDGRHTFVNPLLAKHYGIVVSELPADQWRRVDDAAHDQRGGLLPMAVFLTQNSPGLRTSPVKRGYWVVRRLLGERIPPPPPTVPELPADEAALGELTLRELLAKHREHQSCARCHERFDSIGLAFEAFGPIGETREKDLSGHPVDVRAMFPDGGQRSGLDGLRTYLREHRQSDFVENLCRKLLSYALGRTLIPSDDALIESMRQQLAANEHRFGTLIDAIVTSPQFTNKRGRDDRLEGSD